MVTNSHQMTEFRASNFESGKYDAYRPTYPDALFEYLLYCNKNEGGKECDLLVDVACGTGQVIKALASRFKHAIGIDISQVMLQKAPILPNVSYINTQSSNMVGIDDGTVDLITVAQGVHWFPNNEFFNEAYRILKNHGTLACWCYGDVYVKNDPELSEIIQQVSAGSEYLQPFWEQPGREICVSLLETLKLPENKFNNIKYSKYIDDRSPIALTKVWNLRRFGDYVKTWSSYQRWKRERPNDLDIIDEMIVSMIKKRPNMNLNTELHLIWPLGMVVAQKAEKP